MQDIIHDPEPGKSDMEQMPDVKSLIGKMKIYNMNEDDFKAAIKSAADNGIDPRRHGAFVEFMRKIGMDDTAEYAEGIGEDGYNSIISHYGMEEEEGYDEREGGDEPSGVLPTDEEIMEAMLDAFEQDIHICEKKRLIKFMKDTDKEHVGTWLETLERADFFKLLSSFFGNMGKIRTRVPRMMSSKLTEQTPVVPPPEGEPEEPAADEPAGEEPPEDPEFTGPPPSKEVNAAIMDMYLEGIDVTRRSILSKELEKGGHEKEAEFVNSLSLSAFYNLLSEFFKGVASAMGDERATTEARKREKVVADTWNGMDMNGRELALTDAGISDSQAKRYSSYEWHALPDPVQMAFEDSLQKVASVTEAKKKKAGKMMKLISKIESPQELLPGEVQESVELASSLVEDHGVEEAAKKAAHRIGTLKDMPKEIVSKLEGYLSKAMKEADAQGMFTPTAAPKDEPEGKPKEEPKQEDDPEDDDEKKDKPEKPENEDIEIIGGEPEGEKKKPEDKPEDEEPEEDPEKKKDEPMSEMLKLALAPEKMRTWGNKMESLRPPKGVMIESTTTGTGGVTGAPGVGMLDVFSYGGYLERALPYLLHSTMSRMQDEDRKKFENLYHKFSETNDMVQLTELAGRLADTVEWADATQEGAELVKTLRFMGDFMNMMRSSVDYTKRALGSCA